MLFFVLVVQVLTRSFQQFMDNYFTENCNQKLQACETQTKPECAQAVLQRDLCLLLNNCTSDAVYRSNQYPEECFHCWTGLLTGDPTFQTYKQCTKKARDS